jgi:hypothetical protein
MVIGDVLLELRNGSGDDSEELHAELEIHGVPLEADAPAKPPDEPFAKVEKSVQSCELNPKIKFDNN